MHKLDRALVPAPVCLAHYLNGRHNWGDLSVEHKKELHLQLELLQGRRCAYCEGPLDLLDYHIEHFRRKSRFPALTFAWSNLFWSCGRTEHCGHFKDHGAGSYDPNDLIDPSVHDPEEFLRFFSDGSIRLQSGLAEGNEYRAQETLRVFNLDAEHGPLRYMRKAHCAGYVQIGADLAEFASVTTPEEWLPFLDEELATTRSLPFATAIKHTLLPS